MTRTRPNTAPQAAPPDLDAQAQAQRDIDRDLRGKDNTLQPEKRLDADLAHIPTERPRVSPPRRRAPEEVALVYRGHKAGALHSESVTVSVPDTENDDAVAAMQQVVPGLDEASQRAEWRARQKLAAEDGSPMEPYRPLRDRLVLRGPTYQFHLNENTLVHEDDVAHVLAHSTYRIERAS